MNKKMLTIITRINGVKPIVLEIDGKQLGEVLKEAQIRFSPT